MAKKTATFAAHVAQLQIWCAANEKVIALYRDVCTVHGIKREERAPVVGVNSKSNSGTKYGADFPHLLIILLRLLFSDGLLLHKANNVTYLYFICSNASKL